MPFVTIGGGDVVKEVFHGAQPQREDVVEIAADDARWIAYQALAAAPPYLVPKLLIVDRLIAADKDGAAYAALEATGNERLKRRWDAAVQVRSDDADAIALLTAVGADPAVILAAP
jgi:hypothetical protein